MRKSFRFLPRPGEKSEVDPALAVHTDAHDKADRDRLGPLARHEVRLLQQGGEQAVWEDRRWRAREMGDPNWKEIGK